MKDAIRGAVRAVRERPLRALGVVVGLAALALAVRQGFFDPERVEDLVVSFGGWAPVAWAMLYLPAVFIPYATTVMTIAAGLAFGPVWGTLLVYGVTVFASLLPFGVARRLGREWVERRVGDTRVEKYVDRINEHAFLVVFYVRLIPSLPYELQNFVAGVTRINVPRFMLATALGIAPILFILTFLGDSLTDPGSRRFWLAVGLYLFALLAPALVAVVQRRMGKEPLFGGDGD